MCSILLCIQVVVKHFDLQKAVAHKFPVIIVINFIIIIILIYYYDCYFYGYEGCQCESVGAQIQTAVDAPTAVAVTGVSRPLVERSVAAQLDRSSTAPRPASVSTLPNRTRLTWAAVCSRQELAALGSSRQ